MPDEQLGGSHEGEQRPLEGAGLPPAKRSREDAAEAKAAGSEDVAAPKPKAARTSDGGASSPKPQEASEDIWLNAFSGGDAEKADAALPSQHTPSNMDDMAKGRDDSGKTSAAAANAAAEPAPAAPVLDNAGGASADAVGDVWARAFSGAEAEAGAASAAPTETSAPPEANPDRSAECTEAQSGEKPTSRDPADTATDAAEVADDGAGQDGDTAATVADATAGAAAAGALVEEQPKPVENLIQAYCIHGFSNAELNGIYYISYDTQVGMMQTYWQGDCMVFMYCHPSTKKWVITPRWEHTPGLPDLDVWEAVSKGNMKAIAEQVDENCFKEYDNESGNWIPRWLQIQFSMTSYHAEVQPEWTELSGEGNSNLHFVPSTPSGAGGFSGSGSFSQVPGTPGAQPQMIPGTPAHMLQAFGDQGRAPGTPSAGAGYSRMPGTPKQFTQFDRELDKSLMRNVRAAPGTPRDVMKTQRASVQDQVDHGRALMQANFSCAREAMNTYLKSDAAMRTLHGENYDKQYLVDSGGPIAGTSTMSDSGKVMVTPIKHVQEEDIVQFLRDWVRSGPDKRNLKIVNVERIEHLNHAIVIFGKVQDAQVAIAKCNGMVLKGTTVKVEPYPPPVEDVPEGTGQNQREGKGKAKGKGKGKEEEKGEKRPSAWAEERKPRFKGKGQDGSGGNTSWNSQGKSWGGNGGGWNNAAPKGAPRKPQPASDASKKKAEALKKWLESSGQAVARTGSAAPGA